MGLKLVKPNSLKGVSGKNQTYNGIEIESAENGNVGADSKNQTYNGIEMYSIV